MKSRGFRRLMTRSVMGLATVGIALGAGNLAFAEGQMPITGAEASRVSTVPASATPGPEAGDSAHRRARPRRILHRGARRLAVDNVGTQEAFGPA